MKPPRSRLARLIVDLTQGTLARTGWGLNLRKVRCPRCATPQPFFRRPKNERQRLWGGWTCRACGGEMDKWGRPVEG